MLLVVSLWKSRGQRGAGIDFLCDKGSLKRDTYRFGVEDYKNKGQARQCDQLASMEHATIGQNNVAANSPILLSAL